MFRSVRLKLTLINIAVVGIVLLLFFSGVYILMKQGITRQSEQLMRSAAGDGRFRPPRRLPLQIKHWANWFYVREDDNGNILDKSSNLPVPDSELDTLLQKTSKMPDDSGLVTTSSDTFRYLKSPSSDMNLITMVFLSIQPEIETLGRLRTVLVFMGLAGLVIVFFPSLFLADRALIPIKKSWERQRDFAADASHELRSPLAVIQTNLELVMGNPDETVGSQLKWLENIQAENRRMSRLVNDLLFLARADSNQQITEKRFFSLRAILEEAVTAYEPIAVKKKIELVFTSEYGNDFFGDEARIKQLAVILIDNAVKYTNHGGSVQVGLKLHEGHFEITVADTGEGIGQEHIGRIFERFYRVDKARSRENGGTGLGLSIAGRIAREHRGVITVTSTPDKGSIFKVMLPKILPKSNLPYEADSPRIPRNDHTVWPDA